jgi:NAD-dependent dihydropyrimidine dehydrogenase PreA subunit
MIGNMTYLKNVVTLRLEPELCNGCGMCVTVCPHAVFALNNGRASIVDRDGCMECGACATNCSEGAIFVDAGVGCAAAVINAAIGRDGEICCGGDDSVLESSQTPPQQEAEGGGCCCGS